MKVNKKIYYHIHKIGIKDTEWYVGNFIRFDNIVHNEYLDYYNKVNFDLTFDNKSIGPIKFLENFIATSNYRSSSNITISKDLFHRIYKGYKESRSHISELIFEDVRKTSYSSLPSRFNCIWLCDEDQINYWLSVFNQPCIVFKVSVTGEAHIADGSLLLADFLKVSTITELAHRYWGGEIILSKSKEILFVGDLKILEIV